MDDEHVWFLNPGSVGQPRDGDSRASYMVIDRHNYIAQFHRVQYNIRATQKQMEIFKIPRNFIARLSQGR